MGEATRQYGNPFVINYGDPVLIRIEPNDNVPATTYDSGIGQLAYVSEDEIMDTDIADFNADGLEDMLVTYKDGSMRILKNYGGADPFADLGDLVVIADGIRETYVGDLNGDGREDILVYTTSDKLRAYMNDGGVIDVQGTPICIDIPDGEFNVAQARQLEVADMDGDNNLDILVMTIGGEFLVFYGGGDSYLSQEAYVCDDGALARNNKQLLKDFGLELSSEPIKDTSLRHWPGLIIPGPEPEVDGYEFLDMEMDFEGVDFDDMSKKEAKAFADQLNDDAISNVQDLDEDKLIEDGLLQAIDYASELPVHMRPEEEKQTE